MSAPTSPNVPAALTADLVAVLAFCAAGRRSHDEGVTLGGLIRTAWPFLAGAALGWLLSRGWRSPTAVAPTGVTIWLTTVITGMLLRRATSQTVAASFIVVASLVTASLLLGWRSALELAGRR